MGSGNEAVGVAVPAELALRACRTHRRAGARIGWAGPHRATRTEPSVSDQDLRPLDVDGVGAVVAGTLGWALAFVVLVLMRDRLSESANEWWIWVALTGFLLGLAGVAYSVRRRSVYRRAAAERRETAAGEPE